MEKHLLPLLVALTQIIHPGTQVEEPTKENQVYKLMLKAILWGLCTGWLVAFCMGGFILEKVNTWTKTQEELNKSFIISMEGFRIKQENGTYCLEELKRDFKEHIHNDFRKDK